jgi:hypothetical protein
VVGGNPNVGRRDRVTAILGQQLRVVLSITQSSSGDVMKIARLLLAVITLSFAAACTGDITSPSPSQHPSNDGSPALQDTTGWAGGSGSGN